LEAAPYKISFHQIIRFCAAKKLRLSWQAHTASKNERDSLIIITIYKK